MKRTSVLVAVLALAMVPTPAFAHGDLQATSPVDGARVRSIPNEVTITLTEAPTPGAEARARDGCRKRVPGTVVVDGSDIVLSIDGGEPGRWQVSYRAVSSVDGHQTRGRLDFTVSGARDCSEDEGNDDSGDDIDAGGQPGIVENPNPPDGGSSAWLLWVGGGTILLAGVAFILRRSSQ